MGVSKYTTERYRNYQSIRNVQSNDIRDSINEMLRVPRKGERGARRIC